MSEPFHFVTMAAAELKMVAPLEFDRFVETIRELEKSCENELRAAGPNVIFTAQGKAQLVFQLRHRLENCLTLKGNYDKRV